MWREIKNMKKGECKECGKIRRINNQGLCFWCFDKLEK